ncbi:hypothetical protein [Streptomyces sp. NPDC088757]|uniref:hypothetical protein n=1 Tax=Streptomyces sp. NPDC088757 TaxID=3365889 RepID=UPI0038290221
MADIERTRKEQSAAAVVQARQALADTLEADRVAAERHSAAEAVVTAAEDYFAGLGADVSSQDAPVDSEPSQAQTPPRSTTAADRSVNHLILDVLEIGRITPLKEIYEGVRGLRPGTSGGAIRGSLTKLNQRGVVEIVSRGVYRLLVIPEDYRANT